MTLATQWLAFVMLHQSGCQYIHNVTTKSFSLADLVFCGRKLKDELTLDSYGIESGSTVHILKKSWPEPEASPGDLYVCACACADVSVCVRDPILVSLSSCHLPLFFPLY